MRSIYILIALLLAVDNVFVHFRVSSLSIDRLLEFALFFFLFKSYLSEIKSNPFFKNWNTFLILFGLLQLFINLKLAISGKLEFEFVYIGFIKCFSFLVYSFLFLIIAKKGARYVNIIVFVHFAICVFALLLHPISPMASQMLEIKKLLYASSEIISDTDTFETEAAYISGGLGDRYRLSGPFASSIGFSYFAISSFALNLYMYLKYKRKLYIVFLAVLFVASLLSQTRSLLLGEICLVFGYLFFAPIKRHGLYKLALVTSAVIAVLFIYTSRGLFTAGNSRITNISTGGESDVRPLLWVTGLYAVMNHPLGITDKEYMEAKKDMFRKYGHPGILSLSSHNGLINIGFHYSFLGYILFFFFLLFLLRYINLLEPKYIVFFRLVLFSYLIQISFHNNIFLSSNYPFLMVLMLINIEQLKLKSDSKLNENQEIRSISPG